MTGKTTPEMEAALRDTLRAAAVMPEKKAQAHVREQAGLIFSQQSESLAVAQMELSQAKNEFDAVTKELDKLRQKRRKYDDNINETSSTEEEE